MTWRDEIVSALAATDIDVVAYLPDTPLGPLLDRLEETDVRIVPVAREEEAVGVLSGAWLAGERGALLCQSSGLATAINGLASLAVPAGIPFVAFVTRRGGPGEFNRAQVPFGYAMEDVLDAIGIRTASLSHPGDVERYAELAAESAFATDSPYVLILEPTLTGVKDEF